MRRFIVKTLLFLLPIPIVILAGLFLIPTTPRASKSLLMASLQKDRLLREVPSPRIIFVGGSNLSFGINSQAIKDSLQIFPINTSIHALQGIRYMLEHTLDFVHKDDIIVFIPEYNHYYRDLDAGSEELMRSVFDVDASNLKYLNCKQISNILPFVPKYVITKFKPTEYWKVKESDVYSVNSFNEYGDTYTHWNLPPRQGEIVTTPVVGEYHPEVIPYLESVQEKLTQKGAHFVVSFPCYQASSYDASLSQIALVRDALAHSQLKVISTPERYRMDDTLMFNSIYHLTKQGVDIRTQRLIEDLQQYFATSN